MSAFTTYFKSIRDTFSNSCHTMNRQSCYDTTEKVLKSVAKNAAESVTKSQYYKAPPCVMKVLGGSSNFVVYSIALALLTFVACLF